MESRRDWPSWQRIRPNTQEADRINRTFKNATKSKKVDYSYLELSVIKKLGEDDGKSS